MAAGGDQAAQERKAKSYFFSPLHHGFDTGLEATDEDLTQRREDPEQDEDSELFAYRCSEKANRGEGVSLGTALTVSGAAVNPCMGYHSSPPLAFLMTVFNARLGMWLGNPKRADTWADPGPRRGLFYLLAELFGYTTENSKYVNLADGGFFDNLGIYELVRRRCRFIVACDAEADSKLEFAALGNAIRRCRADFGVNIDIRIDPIRRRETGKSEWHCAVGTIEYPEERAPHGTLVYIKASMTGDEPEDVINYAAAHHSFPHEPTADQWFGESQFESYRKLGQHVAEQVFCVADPPSSERLPAAERRRVPLEQVFVDLRQAWCPPSKGVQESFTRHTRQLVTIFERLRTEKNLAYLVPQVYMEFRDWKQGRPAVADPDWQLAERIPAVPEELTTGSSRRVSSFATR